MPEIVLEPTPDILAALGATQAAGSDRSSASRPRPTTCARNAAAKLAAKHVDLMVANDVSAPDAGFEVDTNRAVLLDSAGRVDELPLMTKDAARRRHPRPGRGGARTDGSGINKEHP